MPKGPWIIVEIAAALALLCIPAVIFVSYSSLPAKIPTHFGLNGVPDRFGEKSTLVVLLIVGTSTFALMSAIPFNPELINVPGERTPRKIQTAIAMIRVIKLEVTVFMAYLVWTMIEVAKGHATSLGVIPLVFLGTLLCTIAIGLFTTSRNAQ